MVDTVNVLNDYRNCFFSQQNSYIEDQSPIISKHLFQWHVVLVNACINFKG